MKRYHNKKVIEHWFPVGIYAREDLAQMNHEGRFFHSNVYWSKHKHLGTNTWVELESTALMMRLMK